MKTSNAAIFRENNIVALTDFFTERGEDVKRTATGSIAFPVVADDGEEGWIEVVVKIPKWTEDDDGYSRAEEYAQNVAEKAEKAKAREAERKRPLGEPGLFRLVFRPIFPHNECPPLSDFARCRAVWLPIIPKKKRPQTARTRHARYR